MKSVSTSDSVAVVTGAGRGIGRAAAIELSRRGWRVALVSRTTEQLAETAALCDGEPLVLPADVTRPTAAVVAETLEKLGRIDGLVHAAGVAPMLAFDQTDDSIFQDVMRTNVGGAFALTRHAWPHLAAGGGGVVFVGSLAAVDPFVGFSATPRPSRR